jgi:hypothetical protein
MVLNVPLRNVQWNTLPWNDGCFDLPKMLVRCGECFRLAEVETDQVWWCSAT